MKKYLSFLIIFSTLTVAYGQRDSINREISFGISMVPPVYPGFGDVISGYMPSLRLNLLEEAHQDIPVHYSIPLNINYRFQKNNNGKNNLSFIAVIPVNTWSDLSYYAVSYGKTLAVLNKSRIFSLTGNLLLGYLRYNGWTLGGHFTYPKSYKRADFLLTGFNLGLTAHHRLTERLFLENEIYLLGYYAFGVGNESKAGITLSKLLSFNLGYKF